MASDSCCFWLPCLYTCAKLGVSTSEISRAHAPFLRRLWGLSQLTQQVFRVEPINTGESIHSSNKKLIYTTNKKTVFTSVTCFHQLKRVNQNPEVPYQYWRLNQLKHQYTVGPHCKLQGRTWNSLNFRWQLRFWFAMLFWTNWFIFGSIVPSLWNIHAKSV